MSPSALFTVSIIVTAHEVKASESMKKNSKVNQYSSTQKSQALCSGLPQALPEPSSYVLYGPRARQPVPVSILYTKEVRFKA